jgi:hypothetical protein
MTTWMYDHAADKTFLRPLLFQFNLPAVTRWAAWNTPVTAKGYTWAPKPLKLLSVTGNPTDPGVSASIELANADGTGIASFTSAQQGSPVAIWAAYLDPAGTSIASQQEVLVCGGLLGTWVADQDILTITVNPLIPYVGVPIPRRLYTLADFPRLDAR